MKDRQTNRMEQVWRGETKKNRRPDRANRPGEGLLGTETSLACFGSENEGKYLKVSGTGYMWEGQKTEL